MLLDLNFNQNSVLIPFLFTCQGFTELILIDLIKIFDENELEVWILYLISSADLSPLLQLSRQCTFKLQLNRTLYEMEGDKCFLSLLPPILWIAAHVWPG